MGMYTELVLRVDLNPQRPDWVDRTLRYFGGERDDYPDDWVGFHDHAIFKSDRWRWFLSGRHAAYMHGSGVDIDEFGQLRVIASFKDYGAESDLLLNWLTPHVRVPYPEFVGYRLYEEDDDPTLIYWTGTEFTLRYPKFHHELDTPDGQRLGGTQG